MSFVSDIITRAYRESNIVPIGATPTNDEIVEGLSLLNTLVLSTIGGEAGDPLTNLNVGGTYDQSDLLSPYLPVDIRLMLNLESPLTVFLDPSPVDGQRFSAIDAASNLATNSLTFDGNGRTIEGGTTLEANTDGFNRQWMYRADLGDWIKISTLIVGDVMPFPSEFDDYFITMLAMRINPRNSVMTSSETVEAMKRMRALIRSRYSTPRQVYPDITPLTLAFPVVSDFNSGTI